MIVDDHAEMRALIRSILSNLAQEFVECANGEDAVVTFASERPAWTVMDVCMPGVNGLGATERIKAQFPDARIVIITQHHHAKLQELARAAGADWFVNKENLDRLENIFRGTDSSVARNATGEIGVIPCPRGEPKRLSD